MYITTFIVGYYLAENLLKYVAFIVLTNSVTIAEVLRKNECNRYIIGR